MSVPVPTPSSAKVEFLDGRLEEAVWIRPLDCDTYFIVTTEGNAYKVAPTSVLKYHQERLVCMPSIVGKYLIDDSGCWLCDDQVKQVSVKFGNSGD